MPALLIHRKTAGDTTLWDSLFAEGGTTLRANGCTGGQIFRNADDPGEVWILLEWDDLFRARLFVQSDEVSSLLPGAGISDVWFLERDGLLS